VHCAAKEVVGTTIKSAVAKAKRSLVCIGRSAL
jgi:hypothetical protein